MSKAICADCGWQTTTPTVKDARDELQRHIGEQHNTVPWVVE